MSSNLMVRTLCSSVSSSIPITLSLSGHVEVDTAIAYTAGTSEEFLGKVSVEAAEGEEAS